MKIEYLSEHTELIPDIAKLAFIEWQGLCLANNITVEDIQLKLSERANKDRIPMTILVFDQNELVGTGSIKESEPSTREGVSPWLDMMYIKEHRRKQGIGSFLLKALEGEAIKLGVTSLYLSTDEAEGFYAKHNWTVIEHQTAIDGKVVAFMHKRVGG